MNLPSPEKIAKCISVELGVEIDPNYYSELIAQIEEAFKNYRRFRKVTGIKFDALKDIEVLDNAIRALEEVRLLYIVLPDFDLTGLIELHEEHIIIGEYINSLLDDSRRQGTRKTKIKSVTDELVKLKKDLVDAVEGKTPQAIMALKKPEDWLAWRLFIALRVAFPKPPIPNYQIDDTSYQLSKLYGVEEKDSDNPSMMIGGRRKRFQKGVEPHLYPPD